VQELVERHNLFPLSLAIPYSPSSLAINVIIMPLTFFFFSGTYANQQSITKFSKSIFIVKICLSLLGITSVNLINTIKIKT